MRDEIEPSLEILDETITVGELIDVIKKYPSNMKVLFTWESIYTVVSKRFIYKDKAGHLNLDADYSSYKEKYAENSNENED